MCGMAGDHFGLGLTKNDPLSTKIGLMREKMIFTFSFPVTYRPQICSTSYSCPSLYASAKLEVSMAFPFLENCRNGTDGLAMFKAVP